MSRSRSGPLRLAILASHPIQYQVPLFRRLAAQPDVDVSVLFYSRFGLDAYTDVGFGREVRWDVPLLGGYQAEFLPNLSRRPSPSTFWGELNPAVVRRIRAGGYDAVWVHGWGKASDWLALGAGLASGIPVVMRGESNLLSPAPPGRKEVKRAVLSRVFRRVSGFLAIGRHNADFYREYGVPGERVFLAPYAVDNDAFFASAAEQLPRREELRRGMGIPDGAPVILFSGKLIDVKRPMDLLRAYRRVRAEVPAALVFMGDGPLRPELEAFCREHALEDVHFAGFRNQSELGRFFAVADVFCLPSIYEPWGLVVNEAMCFGLPVVASDMVGSTGDLVLEGENGFTFRAGDVDALAGRLRAVLGDAELRRRMGARSRELIAGWGYAEDVAAVRACLRHVAAGTASRAA